METSFDHCFCLGVWHAQTTFYGKDRHSIFNEKNLWALQVPTRKCRKQWSIHCSPMKAISRQTNAEFHYFNGTSRQFWAAETFVSTTVECPRKCAINGFPQKAKRSRARDFTNHLPWKTRTALQGILLVPSPTFCSSTDKYLIILSHWPQFVISNSQSVNKHGNPFPLAIGLPPPPDDG